MNRGPRFDSEQAILYVLVAIVGVVPVILVLERRGVFEAEATIGLGMLVLALVGLFAMWRIARKRRPRH